MRYIVTWFGAFGILCLFLPLQNAWSCANDGDCSGSNICWCNLCIDGPASGPCPSREPEPEPESIEQEKVPVAEQVSVDAGQEFKETTVYEKPQQSGGFSCNATAHLPSLFLFGLCGLFLFGWRRLSS